MAVLNVELPLLVLAAALVLSVAGFVVATFWMRLRSYRARLTAAPLGFAFTGLLGLIATVKLQLMFLNDLLFSFSALLAHADAVSLCVAALGYIVFGLLGCWTALRIGAGIDRRSTLAVLYTLVEKRKQHL